MNPTVTDFYTKAPELGYLAEYDRSHGPRLDALVARYDLKSLCGRVLDVGGGLGFLGKRLHEDVDYWVIDGAEVPVEQRLCKGGWARRDIDHDQFSYALTSDSYDKTPFDTAFFLETIEHIGNPHHALVEIKKLVKPDGLIHISIPTETVWHNIPYPGLMWPPTNFIQFLGQMALHVLDFWTYVPATVGWPAYHFVCRNRPWSQKVLAFPKEEAKFRDATPLECTNL